ncbi:helix-turn-helix transcriptional regulator [Cognatiyoonia sp. IB215182]|uniref:helix-turn-helix transcriptional regulator n=1 Tax=Cognatiyoonia sp. IB215182 TaxID=3097353 RepID=UPI002A10842C|nr:AlpA family phage regulatory protein [Cognatiyoonia sp. IB215182]MDX8353956.1 AlpA family phage regulatory protein [Cognatiyoonia sp. IB215182]
MDQATSKPNNLSDTSQKRLATRADLKRMGITLSNTTLLRLEARGRFPRRIRIGGTSVAWLMSELNVWLSERAEERARTHYADY